MGRNSAVHEEIYKGYRIEIYPDEDAGNPQTEWDQAGKMICFHSRYDLGDKHDFKEPRHFIESLVDKNDLTPEQDADWDEISDADLYTLALKHNLIFPLYLYDHGGISIRMGEGSNPFLGRAQHAEWDSGQVGWVYISKKQAVAEWAVAPLDIGQLKPIYEKAAACLKSEVETYNDYLTGNVYGYVVSKNVSGDADEPEWEEVESCWGYYGDYMNYGKDAEESYIMQEAKSIADHLEEKDLPLLAAAGLLKGDDGNANVFSEGVKNDKV